MVSKGNLRRRRGRGSRWSSSAARIARSGLGSGRGRFSRAACACRLRSVRLCGDRRLRSHSVAAVASCSQHTPRSDSKSGCRRRRCLPPRRFLIGSHFRRGRGVLPSRRISVSLSAASGDCSIAFDRAAVKISVIKKETAIGFPFSDVPLPSSFLNCR